MFVCLIYTHFYTFVFIKDLFSCVAYTALQANKHNYIQFMKTRFSEEHNKHIPIELNTNPINIYNKNN